jgi:hypothetical protein
MQVNTKALIYGVLFLILASQCYALGVAPSHKDLMFEPNSEQTVQLKIFNEDKVDFKAMVYAEGELADYIQIDNPVLTFLKSEDSKIISFKIKMPSQFSKQGLHESNIVIRVIPKETKPGETSISATVAVISKLSVMVPYSGKYVSAQLFVPMFEPNKESKFAVDVTNLGTEDAESVKAIIDIYGPLNDKLATVVSEEVTLKSKEKKMIIVPYTPTLKPGNYRAVATVIADEFNTKDERTFSLGSMSINIDGISVDNFKLGGIARFDILLENAWNEKIPGVYGEVSILDKSGNVYTKFKTASVDLDSFEKQELSAYWDTAKVTPGEYKLSIALQYLGQSSEKVYDILVSMNEIKTSLVGNVVATQSKDNNIILTAIYILTALVIILIVLNVLIYFRKKK